jgi:hypothetical protein
MQALYTVYSVRVQTIFQVAVPNALLGRVSGAHETTTALVMLAGMAAASVLGDTVGVVPLFDLSAALRLAAAGAVALAPQTVPLPSRRVPAAGR